MKKISDSRQWRPFSVRLLFEYHLRSQFIHQVKKLWYPLIWQIGNVFHSQKDVFFNSNYFFSECFYFDWLNKKWVVWQGCHAKKPNLQNIFTNTLKTIFRMSKKQEVLISNIFYNIYKGPKANQFIFWEIVFKKAKCQPWCLIHSEQQHSRLNSVSGSS